jgi:hypothetical protein
MSTPSIEHYPFHIIHYERNLMYCPKCGRPTERVGARPAYYDNGAPAIEVLRRCPNAGWFRFGHVDGWCWPDTTPPEIAPVTHSWTVER